MTRTPRRSYLAALAPVIGLGLLLDALPVQAGSGSPAYLQLAPGYGGPKKKNGGPGNEQPSVVTLEHDGKRYVVVVYMNSDTEDGYWQGKCTSIELSATDSPKIVADRIQISDYGGDRPFNHPKLATDGEHIVYVFGSDGVNGNAANTSTYVGVLDAMCHVVAKPIKISNNGNNNEGAPDIVYNGEGYFTAGYLSTGGNDVSYARGLRLHKENGKVEIEKTYLTQVVTPSNIGRPAIVEVSTDRSLFCAAQGDNRPPEDGVRCAMLDAKTGDVLWSKLLAKSEPNQKKYMNQPAVARLDNGRYAVQVIESSGEGKKKNNKGSSLTHIYVIEPSDDGYVLKAHRTNVGAYQAHSTICAGAYGTEGKRHIAFFDASITGVGQPEMQMLGYDPIAKEITLDPSKDLWVAGLYADSGYLANLYGANPNNQGRDFMRCIGDVPNPGFGVEGGYKPEVETFFVAPHAGRKPNEEKNALYVSFIPGKVAKPLPPEPPKEENPEGTGSTGGGETTGSGAGATTGPSTGGGAETGAGPTGGATGGGGFDDGAGGGADVGPEDETGLPPDPNAPAGCACSTVGGSAHGAAGALALVGLAAAFATRRRSREEG